MYDKLLKPRQLFLITLYKEVSFPGHHFLKYFFHINVEFTSRCSFSRLKWPFTVLTSNMRLLLQNEIEAGQQKEEESPSHAFSAKTMA